MSRNFHESYAGSEIKPPSERSTGLLFAAVAVIVAVLWRNSPTVPWVALGMAAMLAAVSLIAPVLLKPINILWFQFGLLLHRVVNPIVMFAMFAAGVCARRRHHASLARPAQIKAHNGGLDLLDRAQGKWRH